MFVPLLMLLTLCCCVHSDDAPKDWDYLALSLRWPGTLCTFLQCSSVPHPVDFVIHGLWPSVYPNEEPETCASAPSFDESHLDPIKSELRQHWPNLLPDKTEHQFWKHEWDHHGRCALEDSHIPTQFDYFKTTLDLRDRLKLLKKLEEVGIRPSNQTEYKVEDIRRQVHQIYSVQPELYCLKHHAKPAHLFEVRICYSASLELIDCPAHHQCQDSSQSAEESCPAPWLQADRTSPYSAMPCPPGSVYFPAL